MTKKKVVYKQQKKRKGTEGILGDKNSNKSIFSEEVNSPEDDEWARKINELLKV